MASFQVVPMPKDVHPQYVEMKVPLYSYGCEKKVEKALTHLKGIHSVHVDYDLQKVKVWGICNRDAVLATIKKKRREARFWDRPECDSKLQGATQMAKETKEDEEENPGETAAPMEAPDQKTAVERGFKIRKSWKRLLPLPLV